MQEGHLEVHRVRMSTVTTDTQIQPHNFSPTAHVQGKSPGAFTHHSSPRTQVEGNSTVPHPSTSTSFSFTRKSDHGESGTIS